MLAVVVFPADPSLALSHFQKYYRETLTDYGAYLIIILLQIYLPYDSSINYQILCLIHWITCLRHKE